MSAPETLSRHLPALIPPARFQNLYSAKNMCLPFERLPALSRGFPLKRHFDPMAYRLLNAVLLSLEFAFW
jgi:hypothetical protein